VIVLSSWIVQYDYCSHCLSSLTKPPKCGVACLIMKEFNKSLNFSAYFKNCPLISYVHSTNNYQKIS
jgi:hypothetical protein